VKWAIMSPTLIHRNLGSFYDTTLDLFMGTCLVPLVSSGECHCGTCDTLYSHLYCKNSSVHLLLLLPWLAWVANTRYHKLGGL
jgi:hypothetical protein